MCLAKPYVVLQVSGGKALISVEGEVVSADCCLTPGLKKGDYILLHDDMIIQKLDRDDALETLKMITRLDCDCNT